MLAALQVLTFKAGLLARLAHDLQLTLTRFEATLAQGEVTARFELASLAVDGVVHGEQLDRERLSESDRRSITAAIGNEILETARHPMASYRGRVSQKDAASFELDGELTLHGVTNPCRIRFTSRAAGDALQGEVTLTPSRFGITPYKALAGAIRLADRVVVRVSLALSADEAAQKLAGSATHFAPASGDLAGPQFR